MRVSKNIRVLGLGLAMAATGAAGQMSTPAPATKELPADTFKLIHGLDRSLMDTSVDPCNDFYQYACGNWSKLHPIPSDSPYSDQFYNLQEYTTQVLRDILDKAAAANPKPGSNEQKIGDMYASCMDKAAIEAKGFAPLKPDLDRIDALASIDQVPELEAYLQQRGAGTFFSFSKAQDFKDATMNIAEVDQGGLGLPERDYYFRSGAKDIEIRQKYVESLAKILMLGGEPVAQARSDADAILKLETALAKASLDVTSQRDPHNIYHWKTVAELQAMTPHFQWKPFFTGMGAPAFTSLNVAEPEFFPAMDAVLVSTPLPVIKAYIRGHYLMDTAGLTTPESLDDASFDFGGRYLVGIPDQEARWKRCTGQVNALLGEALGKVYVEQQFPASSKATAVQMIQDIEMAMGKDIDSIEWMSPATRAEAKTKLHMVANKVGYPDKWRDYSKLEIVRGDARGNYQRANMFETHRTLSQIGTKVDRAEWSSPPPTINAYYAPTMNDINFPAGVLQPAFFDVPEGIQSYYGHIGMFMGHEITHGFDDQGRQFDGYGNLRDWWTPEDAKRFEEKTQCLVDEYGSFQATPDTKLNGKLTLGENTADNGGLRLAYMAFLHRAGENNLKINTKGADGWTPEQAFFLGFAQNWCAQWRPELERLIATTDPHSPDRFRANGVLVNMPEFAKVWNCKAGQKMVAVKACRVW